MKTLKTTTPFHLMNSHLKISLKGKIHQAQMDIYIFTAHC